MVIVLDVWLQDHCLQPEANRADFGDVWSSLWYRDPWENHEGQITTTPTKQLTKTSRGASEQAMVAGIPMSRLNCMMKSSVLLNVLDHVSHGPCCAARP